MTSNKLRILALSLVAVLAQGTCTYAASTTEDYTKDELNNREPGWENNDINKSNYNVNSQKNSFSSAQTKDSTTTDTTTSTTTATTTNTVESNVGDVPESTIPSTGNKGDFWGKSSDGKWTLYEQGVPVSGWKMVRGKWYYMDPNGVMQTGWINDEQTWYYLNSGGDMAFNTYVGNFYVDSSGAMQ